MPLHLMMLLMCRRFLIYYLIMATISEEMRYVCSLVVMSVLFCMCVLSFLKKINPFIEVWHILYIHKSLMCSLMNLFYTKWTHLVWLAPRSQKENYQYPFSPRYPLMSPSSFYYLPTQPQGKHSLDFLLVLSFDLRINEIIQYVHVYLVF